MRILPFTVALTLVLTPAGYADPPGEPFARQGTELAQRFMKQLQQELRKGMREGGPGRAIEVCRMEAPEIPARVAPEKVAMGRTSHRLRNPDNAPVAWQQEMLDHYLAHPGDRSPRQLRLDETRVAHVQPIETQSMCLACHGDDLAPDVKSRLDELYPEDRATGFAEGDLRGIFWVTMPDN